MNLRPTPLAADGVEPVVDVTHVLLDIEGTTCPVQFVSETLFPYAAEHLGPFLEDHGLDAGVQELVGQVERAWREDPDPAAATLRDALRADERRASRVLPYLQWLIRQDRKFTPLKDLQGLVWEEGYRKGELRGPLYADVAPALRRWHEAGLQLAVYSSGSVKAQQLLYRHSTAGDLCPLFGAWFDTRVGSKLEADSYRRILQALGCQASQILFVSDSVGELKAADSAGLKVLFSDRQQDRSGPPESGGFAAVASFEGLDPRALA